MTIYFSSYPLGAYLARRGLCIGPGAMLWLEENFLPTLKLKMLWGLEGLRVSGW